MLYLYFLTANAANNMMMIITGNFIREPAMTGMSRVRQPVLCQKLKGPVNGRFRESGQIPFRLFVDFTGGKVRPCMTENV